MSKEIIYEVRGPQARITLNRPERSNAFTPEMVVAFGDALERARDDAKVRVVVITGAGTACWSGADLHAARGASAREKRARTEQRLSSSRPGGRAGTSVREKSSGLSLTPARRRARWPRPR